MKGLFHLQFQVTTHHWKKVKAGSSTVRHVTDSGHAVSFWLVASQQLEFCPSTVQHPEPIQNGSAHIQGGSSHISESR